MTLETMILCNFQAHRHLKVQFDRITTIVGPTDAGKSAILRALRWCCLNDFAGDDFIHDGEKEASVALTVDAGQKESREIYRAKGKENIYELDNEQFKSFGKSGVPDPIANLLRLNEINFQGQHDSPFWLSESAPEVSRQLNRVVDLSVIDTSLSNIASQVRKANERCELVRERLDGWKKEQDNLKPQQERINEFRALEKLERRCREAEEDCGDLFELLHRIDSNTAGDLQDELEVLEAVFAKAQVWRNLSQDVGALQSLLERIAELDRHRTPPPLDDVEAAHRKLNQVEEKVVALVDLIASLEDVDNTYHDAVLAETKARARFEKETKGQICPLCERKIC